MTSQADSLSRIAEALTLNAASKELLDAALGLILSGEGPNLFSALRIALHFDGSSESITALMKHLEALMSHSPAIGIYLMGRLQPLAGKKKLHDVYDAIELWATQCRGTQVLATLGVLAREVGPRRSKQIQTWIGAIRT